MNTRKEKETIGKQGIGLSHFQKVLTFIGSILGIITACITIYSFSSRQSIQQPTTPSTGTSYSSSQTGIDQELEEDYSSETSRATEIATSSGETASTGSSSTDTSSSSVAQTETSSSDMDQTENSSQTSPSSSDQ